MNFTSLLKHGTIEFRQYEGTTDSEAMINWTQFVIKFIRFGMDTTFETAKGVGETLEVLHEMITQ